MKRFPSILLATGICFSLTLSACSDDGAGNETDETTGDGDGDGALVQVDEDINADTTWTADKTYILTDLIIVNGATLTIEPGTVIRGAAESALIIEKDAMLMAEGTADAPIVFTSNEPSPASGDWGGVVLLGEAIANCGESCQAEGFPIPPTYGGGDDSHNCGTLTYVRVEYAGFAISEGNELNGITFYACGSQTKVHHVQSHQGLDDGIEMFGGTFDADHIVVTGASDDSLDMDQGFRGTIQHVFIHQNPAVGDSCYEISNQGVDFTATPRTSPVICNATCVGSGATGEKSKGINIKEGTGGQWYASIVTNTTLAAALLADEPTFDVAAADGIKIENNIFVGNGTPEFVSGADSLDDQGWADWIWDPARANLMNDPGFGSAAWGSPDIMPTGDVAGNGMVGPGCSATNYIGAVDPSGEDWTKASWINYVP